MGVPFMAMLPPKPGKRKEEKVILLSFSKIKGRRIPWKENKLINDNEMHSKLFGKGK